MATLLEDFLPLKRLTLFVLRGGGQFLPPPPSGFLRVLLVLLFLHRYVLKKRPRKIFIFKDFRIFLQNGRHFEKWR